MEEQSRSILIVDDSAESRRRLRNALEAPLLSVTEASEGVEALWRARQEQFDLIITDIHMPTMDGLTLIRELRGLEGYSETPIIVLTSDVSGERLQEGRSAGASAWLNKPVDMELLSSGVKDMLFKQADVP